MALRRRGKGRPPGGESALSKIEIHCAKKLRARGTPLEALALGLGVSYNTARAAVNGPQPSFEELVDELRAGFRDDGARP